MNYAIEHNGRAYGPSGRLPDETDVQAHNERVDRAVIDWLKTHPEHVIIYGAPSTRKTTGPSPYHIESSYVYGRIYVWTGATIDEQAVFSPRRRMGFGRNSHRRAVSARIFGVLYHGWFFESSGDYCRLKRAKRQ